MFHSGPWYRDNSKNENILKCKLTELEREYNEILHLIENQTEIILNREATSAGDDQAFITENQKKEKELKAQIKVLQNAMKSMGFALNNDNDNNKQKEGEEDNNNNNNDNKSNIDKMKQNKKELLKNLPNFFKQFQFPFPSIIESPNKHDSNLMIDGEIMNGSNIKQIKPMLPSSPFRVCSSSFNGFKGNITSELNQRYESEQESMRQRKNKRLRTNISKRIYHIDPDLSDSVRYQNTDRAPLTLSNDGRTNIEHIWANNIDEALHSFIDGDIIELSEGQHIVSGNHAIYGKLVIRGISSSNWKTLIINTSLSKHFIWIIGKDSRVTFENLLLRSCGAR